METDHAVGNGAKPNVGQISEQNWAVVQQPSIPKLGGFEFYHQILCSPKHILAPMVDHSLLAFRMLCRKYNAHLCYTPMLHSVNFTRDSVYRDTYFSSMAGDRPLVVQFCGNDADTLLRAARFVEGHCDAVDINLGCPQRIASRGNYGAFLMNHPDVVSKLVHTLHKHLRVPVFCKMRIFPDFEDTIQFAKMLQDAGCQLLAVHGRTREQKGHQTGLADWEVIRKIKEILTIPVISNGNIENFEDVSKCLEHTKADGVMSAEGLLGNPALFSGLQIDPCDLCHEFMDTCLKIPTDFKYVRSHLLKMLHPMFEKYIDLREKLHKAKDINAARIVVEEVRQRIKENAPQVLYDRTERERRAAVRAKPKEDNFEASLFVEA